MSAHTPGPWVAMPRALNVIDIQHSFGDVPGAITLSLCRVQARQSWVIEAEANARLIAAAPELLAALELLITEVEESGNADSKLFGWPKAVKATRAAIAKATGGQP